MKLNREKVLHILIIDCIYRLFCIFFFQIYFNKMSVISEESSSEDELGVV
jgi:hypothetical protein